MPIKQQGSALSLHSSSSVVLQPKSHLDHPNYATLSVPVEYLSLVAIDDQDLYVGESEIIQTDVF